MTARPPERQTELVTVHLADIPEKRRVEAAERLIRVGGLSGTIAIDLRMAAYCPRQNPSIEVTADEARRVMRARLRG